ncbi:MAG: hypothetical protein ACTHLZ_02295 [Tepidisphaeraceae bacterium]
MLQRQQAGGPYTLSIAGQKRADGHDVGVGNVWLASSQSNMEFRLARQQRIANDPRPSRRIRYPTSCSSNWTVRRS